MSGRGLACALMAPPGTRPPGPVPFTEWMSTPSSRASRRTAGDADVGTAAPSATDRAGTAWSDVFAASPVAVAGCGVASVARVLTASERPFCWGGPAPAPAAADDGGSPPAPAVADGGPPAPAVADGGPPPAPAVADWTDPDLASSTVRIACPTFTWSPALTFTSWTRPSIDDGTSMV